MYIITGYAFLKTLHFVSLKENSENIEHILTGSLVIGFICYKIAGLIPFSCGEVYDCIGITFTSILIAYLIGLFLNSRFLLLIFEFLKIRDSGKKYLWDDLMDKNYAMEVCVHYGKRKYIGFLSNYESYSNSPHIVLASYVVFLENDIIENNSQDEAKVIILDTTKADVVEIIYNKESKMCRYNKRFCDYQEIINYKNDQSNDKIHISEIHRKIEKESEAT